MSFRLPTADHPARELLDMPSLALQLDPRNVASLPTLAEAIRKGRAFMAECKAVKSVAYVCLRSADDCRVLITIGRRGGWKLAWNFGNGRN